MGWLTAALGHHMTVSRSVVACHVIDSVKAGMLPIKQRQLEKYPVRELTATITAEVTENLGNRHKKLRWLLIVALIVLKQNFV